MFWTPTPEPPSKFKGPKDATFYLYRWFDSHSRLPTLIELYRDGCISRAAFLRILGKQWSGFDNIAEYTLELCGTLGGADHTIRAMMTPKERHTFDALPDTVTIYRGCGEHNQDGVCWSLNRDVAATFPFLNRYQVATPLLVTATVLKVEIVALKVDRDEEEIIVFSDVEVTSVEPLSAEHGEALIKRHAEEVRKALNK